ncbi:Pescadillo like protein [Chelonia mydas]|uniref:Pescadillo like protein n=1 Tax=Chelonia mydas TaxID=8469 RepID=M7CF44_CHEMY|nr:Pescadillo like protein [Chelonia mydas]
MATFTELYTMLLGFVNFCLYQSFNLHYLHKIEGQAEAEQKPEEREAYTMDSECYMEKLSALSARLAQVVVPKPEDEVWVDELPADGGSAEQEAARKKEQEAEKLKLLALQRGENPAEESREEEEDDSDEEDDDDYEGSEGEEHSEKEDEGKLKKLEEQRSQGKKLPVKVLAGTVRLEDKQRAAQEEQSEKKHLAFMMMKKREKYLYQKIMFGKKRKVREATRLTEKRKAHDGVTKSEKKKTKKV